MFRRFTIAIFIAAFLAAPAARAESASIEDAFSPHQGATELVVRTINEAKTSIRVAAYYLTSHPIGEALVAAHNKGVDVKVALDQSQERHSTLLSYLEANAVKVRINDRYAIMHDKFMIIDGTTLELGSFNYTKSAEDKNAENVLVIRHAPQVVGDYAKQWEKLWAEARPAEHHFSDARRNQFADNQ